MLESAPVEAAFAPLLGSISIVGKGATTHPAHVGLAVGLELLMRLLVETRRLRGGL
jgi:aspartyl-tRNA synthetase